MSEALRAWKNTLTREGVRKLFYHIWEDHWQNIGKNEKYDPEERERLAQMVYELNEQMKEKLMAEHEPKKTILKYQMRNPWDKQLITIEITDTDGINSFFTDHRVDKTYEYTLDSMQRKKIIELISEYGDKMKSLDFSMEEIGNPDPDGYNIFLSDHIDCFHFSFFLLRKGDPERFPNRMLFLSLIDKIFAVLKETGVDSAFFEYQ